jgi:transketolase
MADAQDQSEIFRGTQTGGGLRDARSVQGTPAKAMPAFVLGEELADIADRDERIVVLTADLASANRTREFKARHPSRFIDFGIAEKQHDHRRSRNGVVRADPLRGNLRLLLRHHGAEQIRTDCAYPRMPVRAIGHHSGISMGFYGTSPSLHRGPRDDAHDCRADGRVRRRRQSAARHPAGITRPSGRHVHPSRARPRRRRSIERFPATSLRQGQPAARRARPHHHRHRLAGARVSARRRCPGGRGDRRSACSTCTPSSRSTPKPSAPRRTRPAPSSRWRSTTSSAGSAAAVAEVLVTEPRVPFRRHGIMDEFALVGPPAALYAHYGLDAAKASPKWPARLVQGQRSGAPNSRTRPSLQESR